VPDPGHQLLLRRGIARQLIGDHHARCPALALEELARQALGGPLVAPSLHQDVQHEAGLVNDPPRPVRLAGGLDLALIQAPLVIGPWQPELLDPDLPGDTLMHRQR
jgi:hypothetical protein